MSYDWTKDCLNSMTYEENRAINKKFFGFESYEGILCDISIKGCKATIAELEKRYPSAYIKQQLEYERKELAKWEERAKSPLAY